jgi:hypothetical protein
MFAELSSKEGYKVLGLKTINPLLGGSLESWDSMTCGRFPLLN